MAPVDGALPTGEGWVTQPKLDGHRAIVDTRTGLRVWSRRGNDLTGRFGALAPLADTGLVLDGELVVYGPDGRPAFHRVMGGSRVPAGHRFAYAAFDVIWADGTDLRSLPVEERLDRLGGLGLPRPIDLVPAGSPQAVWDAVVAAGLEGVVSKRLGSPYRTGTRSADWRRTKNWTTSPMTMTGWTLEHGRLKELRVLTGSHHITVFHGLDAAARTLIADACAPLVERTDRDGVWISPGVITVAVRHHGPADRPRETRFIRVIPPG